MENKISTGFSITSGSSSSEVSVFECVLDADIISDLRAVAGSTPLDELVKREEEDADEKALSEVKREVVSGLLSFLFKNVRGYVPSPAETATRLWILTYLISPQLIGAMSLSSIGTVLGEAFGIGPISRQTLSARAGKISATLNVRARTSKSTTSCEKYSEIGRQRWDAINGEKKKLAKAEYNKRYREERRDALLERHRDYYRKNKDRILATRKKKRKKQV